MKVSGSLTNPENTVGFVTVTGFEGKSARIDIKYLKSALKLLEKFEDIGYTSDNVLIGIDDAINKEKHTTKNMLMLFLDENLTFGIALASILDEERRE
jgi:hypothetical protein